VNVTTGFPENQLTFLSWQKHFASFAPDVMVGPITWFQPLVRAPSGLGDKVREIYSVLTPGRAGAPRWRPSNCNLVKVKSKITKGQPPVF